MDAANTNRKPLKLRGSISARLFLITEKFKAQMMATRNRDISTKVLFFKDVESVALTVRRLR